MNEPRPRFSIIVAVYNGAATLQQCIDSITAQTFHENELIIIDGGSTDGTVALLDKNSPEITRWLSEPDRGIYHAMNKGVSLAQGEWVLFLGADDYLWDATVLERLAGELARLPASQRVAYGKVMLLNDAGQPLYALGEPWARAKRHFGDYMSLPHQGVLHRRSLFGARDHFDESYRIAGDYELLLRELPANDAVFFPEITVSGMRHGGLSSSPANAWTTMLEFRRAQRKHGRQRPSAGWLWAAAKVRVRMLLWRLLGEKRAKRTLDLARRMKGAPPYWTKL